MIRSFWNRGTQDDQYRICFRWTAAGAEHVQMTDYHSGRRSWMVRLPKNRPPTRPGEMLVDEFLRPHGITQAQLAARMQVPPNRVTQIIKGTRTITPDTARRLAFCFNTSPDLWLNLQRAWDMWQLEHAENSPSPQDIEPFEPFKRAS